MWTSRTPQPHVKVQILGKDIWASIFQLYLLNKLNPSYNFIDRHHKDNQDFTLQQCMDSSPFHKRESNHRRDHGTVALGLEDSINHLSATAHLIAMDNLIHLPRVNALVSRLPNREKTKFRKWAAMATGTGASWRRGMQCNASVQAGQDSSGTRPKCAREHKLAFIFGSCLLNHHRQNCVVKPLMAWSK